MDITVKTKTGTSDDLSWLGSAHGTQNADSIKIVVASADVTEYGDTLPGGTLLSRDGTIDPTGTTAAAGNKKSADGFLLHSIDISRGAGNYSGALLWHGQVSDSARQALGFDALTTEQKSDLDHFSIV